ncbi:MAG: ACP S-malonyltransferase [Acidimicrobiaceae bacterium]|nr:ACP S-malonyltransferase [Acidimicrobiaceae bacterium]
MTHSLPLRDDVVALFPGQGSLSGGAGLAWRESAHWQLVSRISDVAGMDVENLLLDASDEDVVRTDRAQIATFALSLIGYHELLDRGIRPRYLLGHSLGEFSALVASGLLSVDDGARLIAVRGAAMATAAEEIEGTMVALMGGDDDARRNLDGLDNAWVANINGAAQIVLSGTRGGLDYVLANHRELGWRRATPLAVGGAFHSPLMAGAQKALDAALQATVWGKTDHVVIANVDGEQHSIAAEWLDLLSRQLTSPVQFLDATLALPPGVTWSVEMPPAGVLTGLTKRIRDFDRQVSPDAPRNIQEMPL